MTEEAETDAEPVRRRRRRRGLVPVATYVSLGVVANLNAWTGGVDRKIQMGGGDLATYLWALRWQPYALRNGHSPFFTDFMNHPDGVNLLNNTNAFLLALVAAPVTVLSGSITSYNVLQTLAYAASATACYALLRRWVAWRPAAFVGGLLYGFSPFMVAAGWSHLFLVFAPGPPLVALCLDEILVRQRGSAVRWGAVLGVVVVGQFFISSEMLANTAELSLVGVALLAAWQRHRVRAHLGHALRGAATAVVVAGVVLAYPIWFTLFGPQHVRIEIPAEVVSTDLLAPVVPNSNHVLSTARLDRLGDSFSGPIHYAGRTYVIAGIGYLGPTLLALLVGFAVWLRRVVVVRLFAVIGTVAFVASLGPTLKIGTELTGIPLPGRALLHLPVLDATVPYRYGLFVPLAAGVVLAVGLDRLRHVLADRWRPGRAQAAVVALAAAAIVPLVPAWPYSVMEVPTPEYFSSGRSRAIAPGSVLVLYPFPGPHSAETMVWQAQDDFRYRMVGGYQNLPDGRGGFSHEGNLSVTKSYLDDLFFDRVPPELTPALEAAVRDDLRRWRAATVVVDLSAHRAEQAVAFFTTVLRRAPRHEADVAVWYDLPWNPGPA